VLSEGQATLKWRMIPSIWSLLENGSTMLSPCSAKTNEKRLSLWTGGGARFRRGALLWGWGTRAFYGRLRRGREHLWEALRRGQEGEP